MTDHANWYRLDQNTREAIVTVALLAIDLSDEDVQRIKADKYLLEHTHFTVGMGLRNAFRQAGYTDDMLPPVDYGDGHSYSNWDDYYISAIEAALGLIPV